VKIRKLEGCLLLIVEPEWLIATDLQQMFEDEGARVLVARDRYHALALTETPRLDMAVLDFTLAVEGESSVSRRLTELGIPFVICSGFDRQTISLQSNAPIISKPVVQDALVSAVASVFRRSNYQER
jgi:DNA-binding response OmpR family regulator